MPVSDRVTKLAPAALLALVVGVPMAWRLAAVPPQYSHREWLVDEPAPLAPLPLPLHFAGFIDGADSFRLPLTSDDPVQLLQFDELAIVLGTGLTNAVFIEASLTLDGTTCAYVSAPRTVLVNNQPLWLFRAAPCQPATAAIAEFTLDVRLVVDSGRVALWTFEDPTDTPRLLLAPSHEGRRLVVRGMAGRSMPPAAATRADLLAFAWEVEPVLIWAGAAICVLLLLAGTTLLAIADRRASPGLAAGGTAAVVLSLAVAVALVTPPFQVPDEPDHLLTFGEINTRRLAEPAAELARRTHFERLRHRHYQHIRAADIGRPWPVAWPDTTHVEAIEVRSALTAGWWRLLDAVVPGTTAHLLFALRLANALLLSAAVGSAVLILGSGLRSRRPALVGLGYLAIPTLPFYGMGLSDTAVTTAVGVVLSAAAAVIALDGARAHLAGLPLGLALLLTIMSGRRAWVLLPAIGCLLAVRAIVGSRTRDVRTTLLFWAGVILPTMGGLWWLFSTKVVDEMATIVVIRQSSLGEAATILANWRHVVPLLLLVLPAIEVSTAALRRPGATAAPSRVVRLLAVAAAGAVLVPALASYVVAFPTTASLHVVGTTASEYVRAVLQSMAVPLRAAHFDLMLSTLFWGGFGWSDTVPAESVLALVCVTTAVMAAWTVLLVGWRGERRRLALLAALALGGALSLAASAAGAYAMRYDLYGRYLVGWYLLGVPLAWTAPSTVGRPAAWVWLLPLLAVHAYCLQLIAIRYF